MGERGALVPVLSCNLVEEKYNSTNQLLKRGKVEKVDLLLARNEFRDMKLEVCSTSGKNPTKRAIPLNWDVITLHRKFAKEGKLSISFSDSNIKLLISNAPPNVLTIWIKSLAAKMASTKEAPKLSTRAKLLSELGPTSQGISPVTARDISRMQRAEAGGKGLLKARGYTPQVESPLLRKRKRETDNKENCSSPLLTKNKQPRLLEQSNASPVLAGSGSNNGRALRLSDEFNSPKKSSTDLLARSTPLHPGVCAALKNFSSWVEGRRACRGTGLLPPAGLCTGPPPRETSSGPPLAPHHRCHSFRCSSLSHSLPLDAQLTLPPSLTQGKSWGVLLGLTAPPHSKCCS